MVDKETDEKLRDIQDLLSFEDEGGPCPPTCELHVKKKDLDNKEHIH